MGQAEINPSLKKVTTVSTSQFIFINVIGKGGIGKVWKVQPYKPRVIMAMKQMSKAKIIEKKMVDNVIQEKDLLSILYHPFIVNMYLTFQDKNNLYMLMDYLPCSDLRYQMNSLQFFSEEQIKFLSACIITGLEYIHSKNIVHRDIKPANIMIDSSGYLKMIDFGTAKVLTDYTSTVVGTPHYISPEILLGKGYSSSCDYWSLGICAHEIFYGFYPFGNYANEVMEIYKDIVNNDYTLPITKDKYKPINQFISVLLEKDVSKRVCNAKELKKLSIFTNFEWDRLNNFKIVPPYVPKIFDVSNVLNMLGTPFEAELDKESKGVEEESSCDVSSRSHSDKSWAVNCIIENNIM